MLAKRLLCYHPKARGGYERSFCGLSRKPEVTGGKCLGVFCYVPRDLSNGTWIIAIGHHSRKLGRRVCFSVSFFVSLFLCYANSRIFDKGYRLEFSTCQAEMFFSAKSKVQLANLFENWGAGTPLRGFFAPLKTPQIRKKVAVNHAKLCETYSTWSNKIFGVKIFEQGHPQVDLLTKMFGISRNRLSRVGSGTMLRQPIN